MNQVSEKLQKLFDYQLDKKLENYTARSDYAPYGDTYAEVSNEYDEQDMRVAKEYVVEEIEAEIKKNYEMFCWDNELTDEDGIPAIKQEEVLNFINQF